MNPSSDERVIFGGSGDHGEWECGHPSQVVRDKILRGNSVLLPPTEFCHSLTEARDWVGLRPGRSRVRLEHETITEGDSHGRTMEVVHNYGHGGSGLTIAWGCAIEVAELITNLKQKKTHSKL